MCALSSSICLIIASFLRIILLHMCPLYLCYIFPHYLINWKISRKKSSNIKCVFWFSLKLLPETFLLLSRILRGIIYVDLHVVVK
jgi:hypothetical protein